MQEKERLWAEIYRPGSEYLLETVYEQKDLLDATVQAGVELVETHLVSPNSLFWGGHRRFLNFLIFFVCFCIQNIYRSLYITSKFYNRKMAQ
jgi:hypothetical protein